MTRQLFTAADIRRIHSEQKSAVLLLGPVDLITPEAVDLAAEYGVQLSAKQLPSTAACLYPCRRTAAAQSGSPE